jgi:hypothetical protein
MSIELPPLPEYPIRVAVTELGVQVDGIQETVDAFRARERILLARIAELEAALGWVPTRANARLIAAAPDLLAACKEAITELDDCCADPSDIWDFYEKLRSAIAKAEGRE